MRRPRALEELDEYESEIEELYLNGLIDDDEYDEIMQSIAEMRAELKEYYMIPPSLTEDE
ncbi:hypothetical protein J7J18_02595 [bacterium]|nr:hypothetical protein [bacterium]